jgi:hypothetical protein
MTNTSIEELYNSFPIIQTFQNYKSSSKLCIIVHAYYFDVWEDELSKHIQEIKHPYDLYITIPDDKSINERIKLQFPNAIVLPVINRGSDIWPFLYVMKTIKSLGYEYDYILKLHTKKSLYSNPEYSKFFRKSAYENLCNNCDYILSKLDENKHIGMVGSTKTRTTILDRNNDNNLKLFDQYIKKLDINNDNLDFIFGTMFICRFDSIQFFIDKLEIDSQDFDEGHKKDGTLAHAFERLFANMIRHKEQKICLLEDLLCSEKDNSKKNIVWILPFVEISGGVRVILEIANKQLKDFNVTIINLWKLKFSGWINNEVPIINIQNKLAVEDWINNCNYDYVFATGHQTIDLVKNVKTKNKIHFIQDYEDLFDKSLDHIENFLSGHKVEDKSEYPLEKNIVISNWLSEQIKKNHNKSSTIVRMGVSKSYSPKILIYYKHPYHYGRGGDLTDKFLDLISSNNYEVTVFGHSKPKSSSNYNFVGEKTHSDLDILYRTHDIFLDFSRHRGYPTIACECARYGVVSILMAEEIGLKEYGFIDKLNCFFSKNLEDMREKLLKLSDYRVLSYMKKNAIEMYNNFDDWETITKKINEIIIET